MKKMSTVTIMMFNNRRRQINLSALNLKPSARPCRGDKQLSSFSGEIPARRKLERKTIVIREDEKESFPGEKELMLIPKTDRVMQVALN